MTILFFSKRLNASRENVEIVVKPPTILVSYPGSYIFPHVHNDVINIGEASLLFSKPQFS